MVDIFIEWLQSVFISLAAGQENMAGQRMPKVDEPSGYILFCPKIVAVNYCLKLPGCSK